MSGYVIPARLTSIIDNANACAPLRRKSSDGTVGDSRHRAEDSDHNPEDDPGWPVEFIVHAADVSESKPGSPFWLPIFQVFDVHAWQRAIAADYVAASPAERLARWPWLALGGYMVGFDGTKDVIFDPKVSLTWRQNGAFSTEHDQHGHFSIGHNAASENDTQPIFIATQEADVTPAEIEAVADRVVAKLGRQKDGKAGVIGQEVAHQFGGYVDGKWVDAAQLVEFRKAYGLASK